MALIKCNECGKEVSDRASNCPNCGNPITQESINSNIPEVDTAETSAEIDESGRGVIKNGRERFVEIGIGAVVAVVFIVFVIFTARNNNEEAAIATLQEIQQEALDGGAKSESACILIRKVWYNTIFEERDDETDAYTLNSYSGFNDDFNTSLGNLFVSNTYLNKVSSASTTKDSIKEKLKELENHPSSLDKHYEAANELYSRYKTLYNLSDSPSGNIQAFTENYNEADTAFMEAYEDFAELMEDFE